MSPTQAERRESTIARLLDSAIDIVAESGYSQASVHQIAKRSGMSYGALFRHFPTAGDFMAEMVREALRRQLAMSQQLASRMRGDIEEFVDGLRSLMSSPNMGVLYEIMIVGRTDEQLRDAVRIAVADYYRQTVDLVLKVPALDGWPRDDVISLIFVIADMVDGETLSRPFRDPVLPELADGRTALLVKLLRGYHSEV